MWPWLPERVVVVHMYRVYLRTSWSTPPVAERARKVHVDYVGMSRALDHAHNRQADGTPYPGVREQVQRHRTASRSRGRERERVSERICLVVNDLLTESKVPSQFGGVLLASVPNMVKRQAS